IDEVQLPHGRGVLVSGRAGADEAHDLAVDERRAHAEVVALASPVRPQLGHATGRDALQRSLADQMVVRLVPALGVHATEGFRIHIADRTDDDLGLGFGAHARDSTRGSPAGEIGRRHAALSVASRQSSWAIRRGSLPSPDVNVIWRTLLVILRARLGVRRGRRLELDEVGRIRLTTLPSDIDLLRHMNNGRYLSLFDLGRWDLLTRTGLFDVLKENG